MRHTHTSRLLASVLLLCAGAPPLSAGQSAPGAKTIGFTFVTDFDKKAPRADAPLFFAYFDSATKAWVKTTCRTNANGRCTFSVPAGTQGESYPFVYATAQDALDKAIAEINADERPGWRIPPGEQRDLELVIDGARQSNTKGAVQMWGVESIGAEPAPSAPAAAPAKTDAWPLLEDVRFTIRYPPGWRVRERGETDADGIHFTVNNATTTFGGIGVSLLKRASVLGSHAAKPDVAAYAAMLRKLVQVDPTFVKEFTRGSVTGKQFTARQTINGRPATWRLDLVEVDATYVAMVFGFYRPTDAAQRESVETALDTFEPRIRR